ncbi:MAG: beta-ketoacyl-ACP reductase [Actinocrinis sp.]
MADNSTARSVLVTGGNRGIGLAIARAFAEQGDKVAVTYRSGEPPIVPVKGEGSFLAVRCDVTVSEDVERAFQEITEAHGPVEVLVANAGITRDTLLLRMSEEDFDAVLDTNLKGSFRVAKLAAKGMLRLRRGRIVFISSVIAMTGAAGQVNYAASKAGLIGMARSLARELGSRAITSNVVSPGFVDTEMTAVVSEERKREVFAQVPLGRFATVDEIAGVVKFLASPEAAYINGAVIPVDGGVGMGH